MIARSIRAENPCMPVIQSQFPAEHFRLLPDCQFRASIRGGRLADRLLVCQLTLDAILRLRTCKEKPPAPEVFRHADGIQRVLLVASDRNNVLFDFLTSGTYNRQRPFFQTISPSMDILISSNLERMLYYMSDNPSDRHADERSQPVGSL